MRMNPCYYLLQPCLDQLHTGRSVCVTDLSAPNLGGSSGKMGDNPYYNNAVVVEQEREMEEKAVGTYYKDVDDDIMQMVMKK